MNTIFLGTVALEKNRWADGRIPTIKASDFAQRALRDGFSGLELWENHYLLADDNEKRKLCNSEAVCIFNSYLSLKDGITDNLKDIAKAVRALGANFIKYNYSFRNFDSEPGYTKEDFIQQTDTLLRFAALLPENVKLLCECHQNTLMENPVIAQKVFERLDERFGAIIHLSAKKELAEGCFKHYGNRIWHIHTAYVGETNEFELLESADELLRSNLNYFKQCGFCGSATVEFTKENGDIESWYENARKDMQYLKRL